MVEIEVYGRTEGRDARASTGHIGGVEDRDQAQVVVSGRRGEPTHDVLARLDGVSLGRVTTREPTLEDAYVALVTEEPVAADG